MSENRWLGAMPATKSEPATSVRPVRLRLSSGAVTFAMTGMSFGRVGEVGAEAGQAILVDGAERLADVGELERAEHGVVDDGERVGVAALRGPRRR